MKDIKEKIIEILQKHIFADGDIWIIYDLKKMYDDLLPLFEQKEPVKRKIPKEPKIKICAGCGSFAHGNSGHDIT